MDLAMFFVVRQPCAIFSLNDYMLKNINLIYMHSDTLKTKAQQELRTPKMPCIELLRLEFVVKSRKP